MTRIERIFADQKKDPFLSVESASSAFYFFLLNIEIELEKICIDQHDGKMKKAAIS